ncbi:MAG: PAS domain S-box protein, partial [Magnetococcales bacterium]|nr:PAS domain S-box protein [Magnetococcales bacterium]
MGNFLHLNAEPFLDKLVAILEDGIITIDEQGLVTSFNPAAEQLFGYQEHEVLGHNVKMLMGNPYVEKHDTFLKNYFDTNQPKIIGRGRHVEAKRKDGSLFPIFLQVTELQHEKKRQFAGIIRDISEHSHAKIMSNAITLAQQELTEHHDGRAIFEKMLATLLELTQSEYGFIGEVLHLEDDSPYLKTHAITNIAWNEETLKFYEEESPKGMEFTNLETLFGAVMTEEEVVMVNQPLQDSRSGGLPEGHPPLNHFLGIPFFARGKMVGMVGVANRPGGYNQKLVDFLQPFLLTCANIITNLRDAKQRDAFDTALKESEARGKAILEGAVEAIVTVDEKGIIEAVNPATLRIFGYTTEELIDQNVKMLMPPPFSDEHDDYLTNYLRTGVAKVIGIGREVIGLRKGGAQFPMELAVNHITMGGRNLFTGVIRDITEQKKSAEKLKALNDTLTSQVDQLNYMNTTNARLNEMGSYFQTAESLSELMVILKKYCQLFFDTAYGAFLTVDETKLLSPKVTWG